VDESFAGRQARCKHCGETFTIPALAETPSDGYNLEQPVAAPAAVPERAGSAESTYVAPRHDGPLPDPNYTSTPKRKRAKRRVDEQQYPWLRWVLRGGLVFLGVLISVALFAPKGTVLAGVLVVLVGTIMVFAGWVVGAYGAFCEDFLWGFLYVVFPLYAGYYLVTRWDDLGIWFGCSTAGVVLVTIGTVLIHWGGGGG
jgi:hypothetical protein